MLYKSSLKAMATEQSDCQGAGRSARANMDTQIVKEETLKLKIREDKEEIQKLLIRHLKKNHQYVKCPMINMSYASSISKCVKCSFFRGLNFTFIKCAYPIKGEEKDGHGQH